MTSSPYAHSDLSGDMLLRNCAREHFDGADRPVLGKVVLLAKLGQGGMGAVYRGVHRALDVEVAVKVLFPALEARAVGITDRFVREARLAAKIRSDHIVRPIDAGRDEESGCQFLVMDYVTGASADAILERSGGRLTELAALETCRAASRGLEAAHVLGVIHRDIKPANLIVPSDASGRPQWALTKLADLGLARDERCAGELTAINMTMGTLGYAAPEQVLDARLAAKPADVFGMGATLYALLAGKPPFAARTTTDRMLESMRGEHAPLESLRPDISAGTRSVVRRCLAKEPAARFQDGAELCKALDECIAALGSRGAQPAGNGAPARVYDDSSEFDMTREVRAASASSLDESRSPPREEFTPPPVPLPASVSPPSAQFDGPSTGLPPSPPEFSRTQVHSGTATGGGRLGRMLAMCGFLIAAACCIAWITRGSSSGGARLTIESKPSGAAAFLNGVPAGTTPAEFTGLALGRHEVKLALRYFRDFEATDVTVSDKEPAKIQARLVRGTARIAFKTDVDDTEVLLVRNEPGAETKEYRFTSGLRGSIGPEAVEAGNYKITAQRVGHEPDVREISLDDGASPPPIQLRLPELPAMLVVDSDPRRAQVLVDGVLVGLTPLNDHKLAKGEHELVVRLEGHGEERRTLHARPGMEVGPGTVLLRRWAQLDRSGITDQDVVVNLGDRILQDGDRVPPGRVKLVLERPDCEPQEQWADVPTSGKFSVVVRSAWVERFAKLDLRLLDPDAAVFQGGVHFTGNERLAVGTHEFEVRRPLHAPQRHRVVVSRPGFVRLPIEPWDRYQARLDLSKLPPDAVITSRGVELRGLVRYDSTHEVEIEVRRTGYPSISRKETVTLGQTNTPSREAWWPEFLSVHPEVGQTYRFTTHYETTRVRTDAKGVRSSPVTSRYDCDWRLTIDGLVVPATSGERWRTSVFLSSRTGGVNVPLESRPELSSDFGVKEWYPLFPFAWRTADRAAPAQGAAAGTGHGAARGWSSRIEELPVLGGPFVCEISVGRHDTDSWELSVQASDAGRGATLSESAVVSAADGLVRSARGEGRIVVAAPDGGTDETTIRYTVTRR